MRFAMGVLAAAVLAMGQGGANAEVDVAGQAAPPTPAQITDAGIPFVGDRPGLLFDPVIAGAGANDVRAAMDRFLHFVALKHHEAVAENRDFLFRTLALLPDARLFDLAAQAAGRPLDEVERTMLASAAGQRGADMLRVTVAHNSVLKNTFERARFLEMGRDVARSVSDRNPLPEPVTVRVVCTFSVRPYDVASQSFPVQTAHLNSCGNGALPGQETRREGVTVDFRALPENLRLPPEVAERFIARTYNGSAVVAFEASLSSSVADVRGRGPTVVFDAVRTGPLILHSRQDFGQPILVIPEAAVQADLAARRAEEAAKEAERQAARERKEAADRERIAAEEARRKEAAARKEAQAQAARDAQAQREAENQQAIDQGAGRNSAILGARFGMDFDGAVDTLAERIGAEARYLFTRASRRAEYRGGFNAPISDWDPYHEGVLLVARGGAELVAVYHEPPSEAGRVTAISRSRLFEPGEGPTFTELIGSLDEAYGGVPDHYKTLRGRESQFAIQPIDPNKPGGVQLDLNARACLNRNGGITAVNADLRSNATQRLAGRDPLDNLGWGWVDDMGQPVDLGSFRPPRIASLYSGSAEHCPDMEMIGVWIFVGPDGRVTEFHQSVSRPKKVWRLMQQNEAAAMAGGSGEGGRSDFDL